MTAADEMSAEHFELSWSLVKAASDAAVKAADLELKKEIRHRELEADAVAKIVSLGRGGRARRS